MTIVNCCFLLLLLCFSYSIQAQNLSEQSIQEVIVTSDFREKPLLTTSASISVFNQENLERREAEHLEDVLNIAPNVNFSSGASRGRYIQIRGIGERSQFVDPINPSVGLLIDDIDYSGIAGAATALDVKQIEIFRGPQGTLFGANALAGMVNIISNDPSDRLESSIETELANFNTQKIALITSTPINKKLGVRLAISSLQSDGYVTNAFLNREDTQNFDELTIRNKWIYKSSEQTTAKFTALYVNTNNGYDAFSLDNTPLVTQSDQPGKDRHITKAFSLSFDTARLNEFDIQTVLSHADSDIEYSYDEDWTNENICNGLSNCFGYTSFDQYLRENNNTIFDIRALSKSNSSLEWVVGLYARDQNEELFRTYFGDLFYNNIDTQNIALYGQVDLALTTNLHLISGLRFEQRNADYNDNLTTKRLTNNENMWGGKIALEYTPSADQLLYASISRGYKAGGFNPNNILPNESLRIFSEENLINLEAGIKSHYENFDYSAVIFSQNRQDPQFRQYFVTLAGSFPSFNGYLENASGAKSYGFELSANWSASSSLNVWANLGLLETKYENFQSFSQYLNDDGDATTAFNLDGRALPHAPAHQFALGIDQKIHSLLNLQVDIEGKDSFFFSSSNNAKSDNYVLLNARLVYAKNNWQVSLWGKNLTDQETQTRGFFFNNDPRIDPNYDQSLSIPYFQFGPPRTFGLTAKSTF